MGVSHQDLVEELAARAAEILSQVFDWKQLWKSDEVQSTAYLRMTLWAVIWWWSPVARTTSARASSPHNLHLRPMTNTIRMVPHIQIVHIFSKVPTWSNLAKLLPHESANSLQVMFSFCSPITQVAWSRGSLCWSESCICSFVKIWFFWGIYARLPNLHIL